MKSKKNTIYTIAEDLNLSPSTISKSLRGSHEISDDVRTRVSDYCEELGFRRRRFTPSRVNLCAIVQRYHERARWLSGFVNEIVEGVSSYSNQNKVEFTIFGGTQKELESMELARELRRRHIDGAIFVNVDRTTHYIDQCAQKNLPFYCIQGDDGKHPDRLIKLDNAAYTREAVRALRQMGHRDIALMASGPTLGASGERRAGFLRAMKDIVGLKRAPTIVEGHPETFDPVAVGYHAGREILSMGAPPTAIIIEGLKPPIGFLRACHEEKVRIPDDISVITLGNSSELEHLVPALSTIDVPGSDLGWLAAKKLHGELLKKELPPLNDKNFPQPRVILRESTGAPKK